MTNDAPTGGETIPELLADESGRSAVSYGIIACLLAIVAVVAIGFYAGTIAPR